MIEIKQESIPDLRIDKRFKRVDILQEGRFVTIEDSSLNEFIRALSYSTPPVDGVLVTAYAADSVAISTGSDDYDDLVVLRVQLPTLISHLIEIGGVAEDLPYAILSSLSIEQIVKHYHLVPKKKI